MKKRIVSALLAGFLLVSATACGKQPAADAAQPAADPTQAYLDTVNVDYAYDLALKLEDIRSNETLGYRTAGSDAELATGDMLKAEMERIGLQNVTKDAFTLDTQDSLFGLSRRCIPSWVSRAHPSLPSRRIYLFIDSLPSYRVKKVFSPRRAASHTASSALAAGRFLYSFAVFWRGAGPFGKGPSPLLFALCYALPAR